MDPAALLVADQHVNEALLHPRPSGVHARGFSNCAINDYGTQSSFFELEKRVFLASDVLSNFDQNLQTILPSAQHNLSRRTRLDGRNQRFDLERHWLAANRHRYAGRWIAIEGDQLLAVGDTSREVFAQLGDRLRPPLVIRIDEEDLPFGGW